MSTPHDDLQQLYEDASAMQGEQPSPTVRTAVLAHAAMLAQGRAEKVAEVSTARSAANWPHWKSGLVASVLLVPLLGMLMLHMKDAPEWQESVPAPAHSTMRSEAAVADQPPAAAVAADAAPAPIAPSVPALRKDIATNTIQRKAATPPAAPVPSFAPTPVAPAAEPADNTPSSVAALAPLPEQRSLGAASNVEQRAELSASRARESAAVTSSLFQAPAAAAPAPAKTMLVAPGIPRPDAYLLMAAQKGDMAMAVAQLNAGASPRAHDSQGRTALMWAAIGGHTEVIQLLLNNGADRNALDNQGWTALQHAKQAGQKEAAALLE